MTEVLAEIVEIASRRSGLPVNALSSRSAIYQDLGLAGDDVDEFAAALAELYGEQVFTWPWRRFTDLNEPTLGTVVAALAQLPVRLLKKHRAYTSRYDRLELGHIAAVIESGQWRDP